MQNKSKTKSNHSSSVASRKVSMNKIPTGKKQWSVNQIGNIQNFDIQELKDDILQRFKSNESLYTIPECKQFIIEILRVVRNWQEEEFKFLFYLSNIYKDIQHSELKEQFMFQFSSYDSYMPSILKTKSFINPELNCNDTSNASQIIEQLSVELNKSLLIMINKVLLDRKERIMFSAFILKQIETYYSLKH